MSDSQPMREMSLIELINSLPETHIARKEYIKFLGRLSKEKDERLQLEQENARLEDSYQSISLKCADLNSELSALRDDYSDSESLLTQLEQEVKELKARNEELNLLLARHHELKEENLEMKAFLGGKGYTVDNVKGKALAQHDKEQVTFGVTDFVGTVLEHGELCGHDSDFLVECKKEYIKQLQEQE